ncbi:MAG: ABC transporter permease [Burkholderiales bacterium]
MNASAQTSPIAMPIRSAQSFTERFSRINWRGLVAVCAFLALWEALVRAKAPGFASIPGPIESATVFWHQYAARPAYWESWLASFRRVLSGFILAQIIGIPLGLALGTLPRLRELVFPVFELLRPIPPLAWVPLSILFWPTHELSIIFITFIGAFFIIVISVHDGVRTIKREHLWLARSLGASQWRILWRIMLPSLLPAIGVGMALGIAVTWNVVIAAETIAGDNGLGRLTWEGYVSQTSTVVMIGMVSIGLAGYLSSMAIAWVERRLAPWRGTR